MLEISRKLPWDIIHKGARWIYFFDLSSLNFQLIHKKFDPIKSNQHIQLFNFPPLLHSNRRHRNQIREKLSSLSIYIKLLTPIPVIFFPQSH